MMLCQFCTTPLAPTKRRTTKFCSDRCRSAAFREARSQQAKTRTLTQVNQQRRAAGLPAVAPSDLLASLAQQVLALKGRYRNPVSLPAGASASKELLDPAATHIGISTRRMEGRLVLALVIATAEAPHAAIDADAQAVPSGAASSPGDRGALDAAAPQTA